MKIRTKKCKFCKEPFEVNPKFPLQFVCKFSCAIELNKINKAKKEKKDWREKKAVMKEKLKTISDYKKDLQTEINKIVRLIDTGQPCIATGATTGKRNAGHYFSIGSNDTLRFNLHNIHIQSEQSNSYKSGDTLNYQAGIERIYGIDYLNRLNALKSLPVIKLSIPEIKEKIIIARKIVKELELKCYTFNVSDRISLRIEYNCKIGIYQ